MGYWEDRIARAQATAYNKNQKQIAIQMRKYYQSVSKDLVDEFENTYNKLLATLAKGQQPTPADLYKLDKYWKMQSSVQSKLTKLGRKQIASLTKGFRQQFWGTFNAIKLKGTAPFATMDDEAVNVLLNQIWCADGQSWSQRVWKNLDHLQQTLNDELIHCVATGKNPSVLKKLLMERFNVSFGRANTLVETELAHIQTIAAQERYKSYGIEQVEILADQDGRTCPDCEKLNGHKYYVHEKLPIPLHPRCRCCALPVVKVPTRAVTTVE